MYLQLLRMLIFTILVLHSAKFSLLLLFSFELKEEENTFNEKEMEILLTHVSTSMEEMK